MSRFVSGGNCLATGGLKLDTPLTLNPRNSKIPAAIESR